MTTDITTTEEGIKKLAELENVAKRSLKRSKEAFDEAMFALIEIRDNNLWVYARDEDDVLLLDYKNARFKEDYLYLFCRRTGISQSTIYEDIGTVRVMHYLGWSNDQIAEVGVKELKPVQSLIRIDGRSKAVVLPPPEVVEKLPPGDTVEERIIKKVEEVFVDPPEPLSPSDRRKAMVVDTGLAPDVQFFESGSGDVWYTYDHNETHWDGILISAEIYAEINDEAREYLVKKLKIQEYTRRDDGDD